MRYSSDVKDVASEVLAVLTHSREDVLPTVAYSGVADTKTCQSSITANSCHVYGALSDRILPGA